MWLVAVPKEATQDSMFFELRIRIVLALPTSMVPLCFSRTWESVVPGFLVIETSAASGSSPILCTARLPTNDIDRDGQFGL